MSDIGIQVDGYGILYSKQSRVTIERVKPRDSRQKTRVAELGGLFKVTVPGMYWVIAYGYEIQVVAV